MGEILFENVFIDGTKIEANANRYTFVWRSSVNKNEIKMFEKVKELIYEINLTEIKDFVTNAGSLTEDIGLVLGYLKEKKASLCIEFVHGISKHKTQLQKWIEQLEEYKERQEKYNKSNLLFRGKTATPRRIQMQHSCI